MPKSKKTDLQTLIDSLPLFSQCGVRRVQVGEITIEFGSAVSPEPVCPTVPMSPDVSNEITFTDESWDKRTNDNNKLTPTNTDDTISSMDDSLATATSLDVAHIDD